MVLHPTKQVLVDALIRSDDSIKFGWSHCVIKNRC